MEYQTEYELIEKGKSLMPILKDLNQWGKEWLQ
ncbi:winged helix-turn-helix transcriptional regulator [Streptococcus parasanguinis]